MGREPTYRFVLTALIMTAGLAMGASEPSAEIIDSRRYEQGSTQLIKPPEKRSDIALVTEVRGVVQARRGEDEPWTKVAVGDQLKKGCEVRTGIRSRVRVIIGDQTITIDRLGVLRLLEQRKEDAKGQPDRMEQIDGEVQHGATITTPGATLAIRG